MMSAFDKPCGWRPATTRATAGRAAMDGRMGMPVSGARSWLGLGAGLGDALAA
jgi:hypothetical protein